jgi:ligand-binding sensor domain-containing protein
MKQTYPNNQKRKRLAYVSILFVFLSLVVCQSVNSQQNFNFRNFTRAGNNISSNNIRLIAEDQFGKIWTITDHSLTFFNGFWSTISISDTVTCLIFSGKNEIWIGTDTGIHRGVLNLNRIDWIDHYTTEHGLLSNRILTMVHRKNGEIWVGTPLGINRFDGKSWQIALNEETRIIYEDRDSGLWFAHNTTPNFLSHFDGTNHFTFGLNDGIPNSYIQTIGQDDDGNIWVGTNKGVAIYDGLDWEIVTTADGIISNNIKAITTDSQGSIWIGTSAGISFQGFSGWTNLTRANGLASNHVSSILSSSNGGIWVGTSDNGLSFSDRSWQPVSTNGQGNHVNVMFSDQNSIIWIGTQNGIFRTNGDDVVQVKRKFGEVREITQDAYGNLWLATSLGVEKFN